MARTRASPVSSVSASLPPMQSGLFDQPHHDGSPLYVSTQAPRLGELVGVRLRVPRSAGAVQRVAVRSNPDREPRFVDAVRLVGGPSDTAAEWWEAWIEVENPVHGYRWLLEFDDRSLRWLSAAGLSRIESRDVDDFRLVIGPPPPAWARRSVMYQVFPDRFARSAAAAQRPLPEWAEPADWSDPVDNDRAHTPYQFYGGDLAGIEQHLDHLVALGVDLLYLTPFFPARSNHRYDALSFDRVDPLLGGDDALVSLVSACRARGIRVIGDLTTNHSGDAHEWFRAAHRNPDAPESAFYLWLDAEQESYQSWLGVPSLPKFDWSSTELRRRFIEGPDSVVARYLEPPYELDGWRIDVANMTGRFRDQDLNAEVRRTVRRTMEEVNADTLLIGESTNDAAPDFQGDAWHGAMSYAAFTRPLWNWLGVPASPAAGGLGHAFARTADFGGREFLAAYTAFSAAFPWRVRLQNLVALDTHDTPRFSTVARPGVLPVAVGLSMTLPGIPVVWAGAELGLGGRDGEESRQPIPWDRLDEPQHAEAFALYRRLIALRRAHPVLADGGMRWLHAAEDAIAFVRESAEESILVVAARTATEVDLGEELPADAEPLDGAPLAPTGVLRVEGPALLMWRLAGPGAPEWVPPAG